MSIDLTAAEKAARELEEVDVAWMNDDFDSLIHWAVTAAAPLIAEAIAQAIEAAKADVDHTFAAPGHYSGLAHAARIARSTA